MDKICLLVLYKEQNPNNLEKNEELYSSKFDKLVHGIPLYNGEKPNCVSVYTNKFHLSGYFPQLMKAVKSEEYTHYLIIQDGCFLNPGINSSNLREMFCLDEESAFISDEIRAVKEDIIAQKRWALPSIFNMLFARNGAEIREFIPKKIDARRIYAKFGVRAPFVWVEYIKFLLSFFVYEKKQNHPFYFDMGDENVNIETVNKLYEPQLEKEKQSTIYPFVSSEAEFLIIPKDIMKDFVHYSGMLAAAKIHYNIAFATALCFSAKNIVMPKDLSNIKTILRNRVGYDVDNPYAYCKQTFDNNRDILVVQSSVYKDDLRRLAL